jgi:hypothetical protein
MPGALAVGAMAFNRNAFIGPHALKTFDGNVLPSTSITTLVDRSSLSSADTDLLGEPVAGSGCGKQQRVQSPHRFGGANVKNDLPSDPRPNEPRIVGELHDARLEVGNVMCHAPGTPRSCRGTIALVTRR